MVFYDEVALCGFVPELGVVVRAAAGAVLHSALEVVKMNHFVEHRGDDVLDRAGECSCADVEFVAAFAVGVPHLAHGHVTVGAGCALDGDNRL